MVKPREASATREIPITIGCPKGKTPNFVTGIIHVTDAANPQTHKE
jgi:hypothetical protein